jgi:hypothetical protein
VEGVEVEGVEGGGCGGGGCGGWRMGGWRVEGGVSNNTNHKPVLIIYYFYSRIHGFIVSPIHSP